MSQREKGVRAVRKLVAFLIVGLLGLSALVAFFLRRQPDGLLQPGEFPELRGAYLGQHPPRGLPERFAPGIVCSNYPDTVPVFSPDGTEVYWSRFLGKGRGHIMVSRVENGRWSYPEPVSFSQPGAMDGQPTLSGDGLTMLFVSRRPADGKVPEPMLFSLWTTRRNQGRWAAPRPLGASINTGAEDFSCLASDGTLFFSSWRPTGSGKRAANVYRSESVGGAYGQPEMLPPPINATDGTLVSHVAPDQSYMILDSRRAGGLGETDLYLSFRQNDGSWGTPNNMGPTINTPAFEHFASLSPDRRYFFFGSDRDGNMDAYWVEAKIIDDLKANSTR